MIIHTWLKKKVKGEGGGATWGSQGLWLVPYHNHAYFLDVQMSFNKNMSFSIFFN